MTLRRIPVHEPYTYTCCLEDLHAWAPSCLELGSSNRTRTLAKGFLPQQ